MKLIRVGVSVLVTAAFVASVVPGSRAQQRQAPNKELVAARNATEKELAEIAVIDRKLMVPMRDGKRMATDVYRL
jgi:predicted acyl esterase